MQSICLKSTRLFYEVARHSTKMFFSTEKPSTNNYIAAPAPVGPMNPFFRYLKEKMTLLKQDSSKQDFKLQKIIPTIAIEWTALPTDKKQIYEMQYADDINNFKILEEKWWNGLTENQKQQYKSLKIEKKLKKARLKLQKLVSTQGKPKKNLSAINFFIRQNMNQNDPTNMLTSRSKEEFCKLMSTVSNKWTSLSVDEKKIYNEMAEEDTIRYKRELAFWNLKMLKEGKGHLLQLIKNMEKEKRLEKKKKRNESQVLNS